MQSSAGEGVSYRELLEGLLKRRLPAARRAQLETAIECPPLPSALDYLWRLFHRLRRRKGGNGFGAVPLEWPDIDAFLRRARIELAPWELEVIEELDDLFLLDHTKSQIE